MGQVTPNGTYSGGYDSTSAVLTITSADTDRGVINAGSYIYGGKTYNVRGTFFYSDLSNHTSSVSFNLNAVPADNSSAGYQISLFSPDRDYTHLTGDVRVVGSGAGPQYTISLGRQ